MALPIKSDKSVKGEFVTYRGERFYKIYNVDKMDPFFMTITSSSDHWLFVSSNGAVTAGRVSPDNALFPYKTVDKVQDSHNNTGCKTLVTIDRNDEIYIWEPFNSEQNAVFNITRNILKSSINNKISFEEINHDFDLTYRYTWSTSDTYGFIRECEVDNNSNTAINLKVVDGFLNILPAGVPLNLQDRSSNLVDAYKWTEFDPESRMALFTLYSGISDRAEPCESLTANIVFCVNSKDSSVLLSNADLDAYRNGNLTDPATRTRGVRGAYFTTDTTHLEQHSSYGWSFILDVNKTQGDVIDLRKKLLHRSDIQESLANSIQDAGDENIRIMASCDALQVTAEEIVSVHHYANVLFNVLRGGYFKYQYSIDTLDYVRNINHFNHKTYSRHRDSLDALKPDISYSELLRMVDSLGDSQLIRLTNEYLPITFGRRHGDPSRPWNKFTINVKDNNGNAILSYEGNWRDIFQNWEALLFSYPEFIEGVIAKFVNASTMDGYNPYRITKKGIDWEIEEPDEPWSNIGYWGDHQIIYLLKLLELSNKFRPGKLHSLLRRTIYCYANVPYKIDSFESLIKDPKNTVTYDLNLSNRITSIVEDIGADGKLILDEKGEVLLVNLLEKLLIPLLAKLANLVVDGGIWLNTQRPEWNDANNALVGQGLSVVTVCYLCRYIRFLRALLNQEQGNVKLSLEVQEWLNDTIEIYSNIRSTDSVITNNTRYYYLEALGHSSSKYREKIYSNNRLSDSVEVSLSEIKRLLDDSLYVTEESIKTNRRNDGLYHTYNLLEISKTSLEITHLYKMLEGQVAVLSSGILSPVQAVKLLKSLYASDMYRTDIDTFMLYPDRDLPGFLEKNIILKDDLQAIPLLRDHINSHNDSLVYADSDGKYRFKSDLTTLNELIGRLDTLVLEGLMIDDSERELIINLYKKVFNHQAYTGRSGTMFAYEGLGCVYWHMIGKLLLAVQENYFSAVENGSDDDVIAELAQFYYRIRNGLGFNKQPSEYGAFPMDPYSHTPKQGGAQQPGMTGQVKEEILARFGELGIEVKSGEVSFNPRLLRMQEFSKSGSSMKYYDTDDEWNELSIPENSMAFTWCQLPIVYTVGEEARKCITIHWRNGTKQTHEGLTLNRDLSSMIFKRTGDMRSLYITISSDLLHQ